MRMVVVVTLAAMVHGCSDNPPPAPKGLRPAPAWMTDPCPDLPNIPAGDGDPRVRTPHNVQVYQMYARCSLKQRGLAARDANVTRK